MRILAVVTTIVLVLSFAVAGEHQKGNMDMGTVIVLKFNNEELVVRLNDSQASMDFVQMLPITLTFRDYNGTEKIGDLPRPLSLDGSPSGHEPSAGDFTYYSPWGNLAIFYRRFHYSNGLIPLGVIESGVDGLASLRGDFSVRIEAEQ